ncbi:RNA polymerase sigma-70 factor (ECF subfamily) [Lewinella aquimaris]|uniref:RNA polymerase sigma-70 factor (ECF subfamily) n=1 Tax=Neolewinella aquimaris TaxID=1835722 RepID=A0A840E8G8_9BACT|nr:sigma-70 family RNA polymerase sigma factor [Neolewinella aquimaris]MBB4079607.1 RNA polymerase sigma-70 factor (ECF subfamily) [Neolewinella aquimaris]
MEDIDIIRAYRERRHATCFQILYDRYSTKVYSKAVTMLRKQSEAEDATQEIFTKIFLNLGKFQGQSKFSTWVYSITYNLCIDKIRREKKVRDLFNTEMEDPPDTVEEVPDEALLNLQLNELKYVLSKLTDTERMMLLMKYKDGVKIKAIASLLDKSESAVKMQLKRIKEKAKRIHEHRFASTPS